MKNRKDTAGFSTLFLVMILGSVCFLLMILLEAVCGHAMKAEAGAFLDVTGRSLLSEYDRSLYDRYGIFALQQSGTSLQKKMMQYLNYDTEKSTGVTSMNVNEASVSTENYPGLCCALLEKQMVKLGKTISAYTLLTEADTTNAGSRLFTLTEETDSLKAQYVRKLDSYISRLESSSATDGKATKTGEGTSGTGTGKTGSGTETAKTEVPGLKQAKSLKKQYEDALDPDLGSFGKGIRISSLCKLSQLPTGLLGVNRVQIPQFSADLQSGNDFFTDEYILFVCSDAVNQVRSSKYPCETEYILFGKDNSRNSENAMRQNLFSVRFAVQLAAVYADPALLSEIQAEALAFTPVPQPLAVFVLACSKASASAGEEVRSLLEGKKVAMLPPVLVSSGESSLLSYQDYLRLFLLCLPTDTKIARFMDIVQCNMLQTEKAFSFQNCAYGVSIKARFTRYCVPLASAVCATRSGNLERTYEYQ